MGSEQRYDIYDLFLQFPGRRWCRASIASRFPRRMAHDGSVVMPLDLDAVRAGGAPARRGRRRARLAICFLHSYRNPAHERAAGAPGAPASFRRLAVSLSSDVVAELWEYERCVTTCANAYVQPLIDRYPQAARAGAVGPRLPRPRCG